MVVDIAISHVVGRCPVCGSPILDGGFSDDNWEHDWMEGRHE